MTDRDLSLIDPVVVIGSGLLGASVGMRLTSLGVAVQLRDAVHAHARVAATLGAGSLVPLAGAEVKVVVVAVPPRALASVVAEALEEYPHAVVTDVGSVKGTILQELRSRSIPTERYVGAHPMAGSHKSGPVTSRADLFEGRTWVVTPHQNADPDLVERVAVLGEVCGARVLQWDADDHDAAVARVSHLPHLMSVLMAEHLVDTPTGDLELAGQGLRDVTRIAGGDPYLWEQILVGNRAALVPELRTVRERLDTLITLLDAGDRAGVRDRLVSGNAGTRAIPGKHGAPSQDFAELVVEIPDTPGALAKLFADIDGAGINIEDVTISHDQTRQIGYLSVAVQRGEVDRLADLMRTAGWTLGA